MSEKVTFARLIDQLSLEKGVSKKMAREFLKALAGAIEEGSLSDERVRIRGFGVFKLRWVKSRLGTNPQTGLSIEIPGHNKITYRPDASLKRKINARFQSTLESGSYTPERRDFPTRPKGKKRLYIGLAIITAAILLVITMQFFIRSPEAVENQPEMATLVETPPPAPDITAPVISEPEPAIDQPAAEDETTAAEALEQTIPPAGNPPPPEKQTVTIKAGDNLWALADEYLGDPYLWPLIFKENMEQINNPDRLIPDMVLTIPNIEGPPSSLTQDDQRNLADGNVLAYLSYSKMDKSGAHDFLIVARALDPLVIDRFEISKEEYMVPFSSLYQLCPDFELSGYNLPYIT